MAFTMNTQNVLPSSCSVDHDLPPFFLDPSPFISYAQDMQFCIKSRDKKDRYSLCTSVCVYLFSPHVSQDQRFIISMRTKIYFLLMQALM